MVITFLLCDTLITISPVCFAVRSAVLCLVPVSFVEISGDGKLLDATVAGKEIEDSKEYKVATLDYLAEGNDHMTAFAKVGDADKLLPENATVRQLFLNYVNEQTKAGKKIDSKIEGRITVKE